MEIRLARALGKTNIDRPIRFGGIEAGGTKFICAVGNAPGDIVAECRIETTTPEATTTAAIDFFKQASLNDPLGALGIASFGPIQINPARPDWGHILQTPKPGWSGFDLAGAFRRGLNVPVALDTDVNGAALGEYWYGAGQGLTDIVYVTIGTGIGAGLIANGAVITGSRHPEIGHIRPRRHPLDLDFPGCCPFHGDCFEGLASGPSIIRRYGRPLHQLPQDHPMWRIEVDYLVQLCAILILTASPARIILGGGVMQANGLLERIGQPLAAHLADYPAGISKDILNGTLIVAPGLAERSGIIGALAMAHETSSSAMRADRP